MDTDETRNAPHVRALPSERVRALAEIVKRAWEPFTDDERIDLLAMVNADRSPLDASTVEKMIQSCGSITLAAKALGIARRTLQIRMRHFGMPTGRHGRKFK